MILLYLIIVLFGFAHKVNSANPLDKTCLKMKPVTNNQVTEQKYISWFIKCIVVYYEFKVKNLKDIIKSDWKAEWESQPSFKGLMKEDHFNLAGEVSEDFFKNYRSDWSNTVQAYYNNKKFSLLTITAARYLYVTYLLYQESRPQEEDEYLEQPGRLTPCEMDKTKYKIPNYACFPIPYGSATCTSDYDVGLIGPKSGLLVASFNYRFQEIFHKPSEEVFDTNIYAFTLEYAMPSKFTGLPPQFAANIEKMETHVKYQAQDLVSALFKVKKYRLKNYLTLYESVEGEEEGIRNEEAKCEIAKWTALLYNYELKKGTGMNPSDFSRKDHNERYATLVKSISETTENAFEAKYIEQVMLALLYAAEAYHSRGAIRHIVGVTQMGDANAIKLTPLDLWCSMLENWGDSMKEYNHQPKKQPAEQTLLKMSKYMARTWLSMKYIRNTLKETTLSAKKLTDCSKIFTLFDTWIKAKKSGKSEIEDPGQIEQLYVLVKCEVESKSLHTDPLSGDCLDQMFILIEEYSSFLMEQVFLTNRPLPKLPNETKRTIGRSASAIIPKFRRT